MQAFMLILKDFIFLSKKLILKKALFINYLAYSTDLTSLKTLTLISPG